MHTFLFCIDMLCYGISLFHVIHVPISYNTVTLAYVCPSEAILKDIGESTCIKQQQNIKC